MFKIILTKGTCPDRTQLRPDVQPKPWCASNPELEYNSENLSNFWITQTPAGKSHYLKRIFVLILTHIDILITSTQAWASTTRDRGAFRKSWIGSNSWFLITIHLSKLPKKKPYKIQERRKKSRYELPLRYSLFFCIILKMKSLSNIIPFDFVLKIKFDRDFILKSDAKKKVSISEEYCVGMCLNLSSCQFLYVYFPLNVHLFLGSFLIWSLYQTYQTWIPFDFFLKPSLIGISFQKWCNKKSEHLRGMCIFFLVAMYRVTVSPATVFCRAFTTRVGSRNKQYPSTFCFPHPLFCIFFKMKSYQTWFSNRNRTEPCLVGISS